MEVCEFLEEQLTMMRSPLNMRILVDGAFPSFIQHMSRQTEVHWKDMIRAMIREQAPQFFTQPVTVRKPLTRAEKKAQHQQIVREILATTDDMEERLQLWRERTGLEKTPFYDRWREIKAEEDS